MITWFSFITAFSPSFIRSCFLGFVHFWSMSRLFFGPLCSWLLLSGCLTSISSVQLYSFSKITHVNCVSSTIDPIPTTTLWYSPYEHCWSSWNIPPFPSTDHIPSWLSVNSSYTRTTFWWDRWWQPKTHPRRSFSTVSLTPQHAPFHFIDNHSWSLYYNSTLLIICSLAIIQS